MRAFLVCLCALLPAQDRPPIIGPRLVGPSPSARGPFFSIAPRIFGVDSYRLIMPDWLRDVPVNLTAATPDELRDKLVEQLSIVWHTEQRMLDVWVVRRRQTPPPPPEGPRYGYGRGGGSTGSIGSTISRIWCDACDVSSALRMLTWSAGMPVIDETGLKGPFKLHLQWKTRDDFDTIRVWRENANLDLVKESRMLPVVVIDDAARPEPKEDPPRFACEATPFIRAALDALPSMDDLSLTYEQRMAPRRALARENPDDVFVQMALQDEIGNLPHLTREWDEALAAYRKLDHAFLGDFLEARLRLAFQKSRSAELLEGVLRQAPDFPWAHLAMARWIDLHAPSETARAEGHIRAFRKLCPGSAAVLEYLGPVRDVALLREAEQGLSRVTVPARLKPFSWRLILRTREDLGRAAALALAGREISLARFSRPHTLEWARAMREGYKLVRDEAGQRWIGNIILNEFPESALAYEVARERGGGGWEERLPELPQWTVERWRAARSAAKLPATEAAAAADAYLKVTEEYPDVARPAPIEVAELYARRRIRLDRVKPLVQQGIEDVEVQEKYRRESDVAAQRDAAEKNIAEAYRHAREVLAAARQ